jgi:hypothetical protein
MAAHFQLPVFRRLAQSAQSVKRTAGRYLSQETQALASLAASLHP